MSQMVEHAFTETIRKTLEAHFGDIAEDVFTNSPLLEYLNYKTRSANKGSKARSSFANIYALYVLIEDYIQKGYTASETKATYADYEGAAFTDLFRRQRELPFGSKLQNHALNARLNEEFRKLFPMLGVVPIIRDLNKQKYWIHEDFLLVDILKNKGKDQRINIAQPILDIVERYIDVKREAFTRFLTTCKEISKLNAGNQSKATEFIKEQLAEQTDARIFEIVSFAILKTRYGEQSVWFGNTKQTVKQHELVLYKTGRTNANDGGIDFVMRPIGRFFQVTETIDANKYFLDIDKTQKFPITFVVKSNKEVEQIRTLVYNQALSKYKIVTVVDSFMAAIEEIINTVRLLDIFHELVANEKLPYVLEEIVLQSKLEFNLDE